VAAHWSAGAIAEISGTIENLSEKFSSIAAAAQEEATHEISRNVQQAAQGTCSLLPISSRHAPGREGEELA